MSPYPVDYGSSAGSGGGAGAGAFSPSHQYNMSQNPALQSVAGSQMQHRQQHPPDVVSIMCSQSAHVVL